MSISALDVGHAKVYVLRMLLRLIDMPKLKIDNREVEVADGATIFQAAEKLGIEIPTMCFLKGYKPSTSCMACVVKVDGSDNLVPACGAIAKDGMRVESNTEEIRSARTAALELLLSDHVGDCMGPCQVSCPANMNIPLMIRQISMGQFREAITTVKKDIALPAILGRICPAPCERACRRAVYDEGVSICLLKRYVADVDLQSAEPFMPVCEPVKDKRVAIIGAGPAGLAASYYLRQQGFACTIFDEHEEPGGMLRYAVPEQELPREVLDKEVAVILKLGVKFQGGAHIGTGQNDQSIEALRRDYDAVFVAMGQIKAGQAQSFGLEESSGLITVNIATYETNLKGVFAGGDSVRRRKLTVRAVADGKEAAVSIGQYLSGKKVAGLAKPFNTHIGKLKDGEVERFLVCASRAPRMTPSQKDGGFTDEQARKEAARCLRCDCRKAESCKLRRYAQVYGAKASRYKRERRTFVQIFQHPDVIYEPGKCIYCGLCISTAEQAGEKLGLTFVGRGFDVRVAVPFDRSIADALKTAASRCVAVCPTGALAFKDENQHFQ
jgi:NADPH-dependent glutamate synthase beta subunit-like oxidoreductase